MSDEVKLQEMCKYALNVTHLAIHSLLVCSKMKNIRIVIIQRL